MARVDYTETAEAYRRARTLPPEVLDVWRTAIDALDLPHPRRVLDVGAGPGGFLDALTEWFDTTVVAVEPSAGMRQSAATAGLTDRFPYLAATVEALPVGDGSIDLAWVSTVIHQIDDRDAAARELRRVSPDQGRVLVRGFFSDMTMTGLLASFPGIDRAARTFPSTEAITSCFDRAGFAVARIVDVIEPWCLDPAAWTDRVHRVRNVDSVLRALTDAEIAEGLRVVADASRGATDPIASDTTLRLVVFTPSPAAPSGTATALAPLRRGGRG